MITDTPPVYKPALRFPPNLDRPPFLEQWNVAVFTQPKSYPHLPVKAIKSGVRLIDGPLPRPSKISVVETRGSTQSKYSTVFAAQAFFSRSLLCHLALLLIRFFLVLLAP